MAWFGGIALILSGDFFQYAPVGGTALYTPISRYAGQTDDEIQKRLGRLAWKTINTVVTLTEQQRMKLDPEYALAVSRLRVRECTYEDVDLFNSRVIRSADNLLGVDMGTPQNIASAAIVATNNVREALNARKAEVTCGTSDLVAAHAFDRCTHRDITHEERLKLLRLNFNNVKASNSLPGVISLYVGMPVILRVRNISTDLGITNGSQGIVRHLVRGAFESGLTHVKCAIVEFPTSKVHLSDLPRTFFPVVPVNWSFTTLLEDDQGVQHKLRITRHQLPIQPAFAVTGHSAQGKTLPSVLVDLRDGGFGAYVAASRARTREGLCVTHPVTREQLNKPLPVDLIREVRRFEAIEHNTYIRCGLLSGEYIPVPDAEAERSNLPALVCSTSNPPSICTTNKRKRSEKVARLPEESTDDRTSASSKRKHLHKTGQQGVQTRHDRTHHQKRARTDSGRESTTLMRTNGDAPFDFDTPDLFSAGCSWDAINWSCAYDCVFMIMYGIYASEGADWRGWWKHSTPLTPALAGSFTALMQSRDCVHELFNLHRNAFRDALTHLYPSFPRYGQVGASASAILECVIPCGESRPYVSMICFSGCNVRETTIIHSSDLLPSLSTPYIWSTIANAVGYASNITHISVKTWTSMFLQSIIHRNKGVWSEMTCPDCNAPSLSPVVCFSALPPILIFEGVPGAVPQLIPSDTIDMPLANSVATYDLRGVIRLEGFHFTARLMDKHPSRRQWMYDGQKNAGKPSYHNSSVSPGLETEFLYVYSVRSSATSVTSSVT